MEGICIMNSVNFLAQRSKNSIRKEINNIIHSYNNSWDFLCELFQNSFDAIVRYNKLIGEKRHKIEFTIDVSKRQIIVKDTGIGIKAALVQEIVAPNGTDKEDEMDSIGEKGVGLTYTIFSCNNFAIETQNTDSFFKGEIKWASSWRNKSTDTTPALDIIESKDTPDTTDTYTIITLGDVDKFEPYEDDLFCQPPEVIEYIIRTRTVLGFMKKIYGEVQPDIEIEYTFIDGNGTAIKNTVPFSYMLPTQFVGRNYIDFEDFIAKAATYDDKQKTQKLRGKALYKTGHVTVNNRRLNYYCFFAPSRSLWKEICEKNNLFLAGDKEQGMLLTSGIYVVTKGMPTGIVVESPATGSSGYWNNFYMLIEDDKIVFDLGRKYIPSRTKGTIKGIAKNLFSEFLPYMKYVTTDPSVTTNINSTIQQVTKNNLYATMQNFANLKLDEIGYLKNPNSQEAAVVSIFHELIGAKILKGYYSLSTGYKQTYDLWTTYSIKASEIGSNYASLADDNGLITLPCVIEFKYAAEDIINDLSADIKFFNDMDLLVCWDLDEQKFAANAIDVEQIPDDNVLFYGSNYKLTWPGAYNLGAASEKNVLALRRFIENYILKKKNNTGS